ncbi:MAG TPA: anthranilate phosphoribosyltransferase [Candidatus Dormibacteraeota bacterium]|jgi:anthranilate phosphoribosyltransferase|nr:anthranilate phosphoribosyltransferase [Candidatus Dormibacteraeota bacterium]
MTDGDTLLRDALGRVVRREDLDIDVARGVMDRIMEGAATPAQIGALVAALRTKGETVDELAGMVMSMRDHATHVELSVQAVDTCGTGGDGTGTFNISTAAALVVAGAGCPVAKHGNRAASSRCGSADVLEALGVVIALGPEGVQRCVEEAGIGFLFAPAFHPAMRHAAGVRSELGIRTAFNVLGPLANPARVPYQSLGVADARLAGVMAGVLHRLGLRRALVFTGPDGIDELGLDGVAQCHEVTPDGVRSFTLDPRSLGIAPAPVSDLKGGDAQDNARRICSVLEGVEGPARDVVTLNAAAALVAAERAPDFAEGLEQARSSIDSGSARRCLDNLVRVSQAAAA